MCAQKIEKELPKTILSVTDFSKRSTNAIAFAANLFVNKKLKILLLNIFQNPDEAKTMLILVDDILGKESEKGLKKQSVEITSLLKGQNLDISVYSMSGTLKRAVNTITQTEDIDLIVAGIPAGKYSCKNFENLPILFMGQSRYPVLLVPEKCSDSPVKDIFVLNLDSSRGKFDVKKSFKHLINHNHLTERSISINEKKTDKAVIESFHNIFAIQKQKTDIIIIIPSPGDSIDRAMLGLQIDKLCPIITSLLNP